MFAIEATQDNMQKILDREVLLEKQLEGFQMFVNSRSTFYLITGYVPIDGGVPRQWTMLPEHKMDRFEYDAEKIKNDWTIMFRK